MKVVEIAFTVYAVTDMSRSRMFYEGVLGLAPSSISRHGDSEYVEYEIGDTAFALGKSPEWKPSSDGGSVAFEVADFDAAVAELRQAGVKFRVEPLETPVCHMAIVFDPDDNVVCIHKRKASAS